MVALLQSIRVRLTAWYTVMFLVGLGLCGAIIAAAGNSALMVVTDARLADRIDRLSGPLDREIDSLRQNIVQLLRDPTLAATLFPSLQPSLQDLRTDAGRARFIDDTTRDLLHAQLRSFAAALPPDEVMEVWAADGSAITPTAGTARRLPRPRHGMAAAPTTYDVLAGGVRYRVVAQRVAIGGGHYDVLTASSTDTAGAVRREVLTSLRWLIPLFVLLSAAGGYWMSSRALKPVDEITTAARSISIQNLSQRLEVASTHDELQRLTETWNGMLDRLDTAVGRLRQFTSDASHELRTPTTAIQAVAELSLRRERQPHEYRAALTTIHHEARRMGGLVEDLLALARAERGTAAMPLAGLDLADLATGVCDDYRVLAEERGLQLLRDADGRDATVCGHALSLRRLLVILLDNALKHTPRDGQITVSTAATASEVWLEVADTGDGVPREAVPYIFDRFYRVNPVRARDDGAGLGLSLARAIVDRHGADIGVEPSPGGGATFRVVFPRGEPNAPATPAAVEVA